ncbi:MAG TPA: tRNA pseudouridine(38-40) synthase TruA [Thermoanaerobaculia bacterium]|nr:tRNA pseudouridine(38-40) synthase TruA [Thermoanaerobaculia bacterium]
MIPSRAPSTTSAPAGAVLRATIEYDGSRYRGWQAQVNARTVQGVLLAAARELWGPGVRVHGAGRTDAGVHALGQVASVHLPPRARADAAAPLRRWNELLPFDVNVLALAPAAAGFHARHDAVRRVYRYRIATRRTAFGKPFVYWVKDDLDVAAMDRAARLLAGRHDFAGFCENPEGHDSTIVVVEEARVAAPAEADGLVLVRIAASHFLWKMVRRVVGVLLEVGAGRMAEAQVGRLLVARASEVARLTVPPSGLFLESVGYPGEPAPEPPHPLRPAF